MVLGALWAPWVRDDGALYPTEEQSTTLIFMTGVRTEAVRFYLLAQVDPRPGFVHGKARRPRPRRDHVEVVSAQLPLQHRPLAHAHADTRAIAVRPHIAIGPRQRPLWQAVLAAPRLDLLQELDAVDAPHGLRVLHRRRALDLGLCRRGAPSLPLPLHLLDALDAVGLGAAVFVTAALIPRHWGTGRVARVLVTTSRLCDRWQPADTSDTSDTWATRDFAEAGLAPEEPELRLDHLRRVDLGCSQGFCRVHGSSRKELSVSGIQRTQRKQKPDKQELDVDVEHRPHPPRGDAVFNVRAKCESHRANKHNKQKIT